ncbi:MAG TPA: zinc-dependent alcohol dehydrogenase family protein [Clostridiaceae bacterium]|nr:zinc-dependent alcohol dehydrogenase family protein [Clostridiaceae bacterium]
MKAARFYKKHQLLVEDVPIREPEQSEVVIRIKYCGVCGTDVHIYEGEKGSAQIEPPVTLGHEISGEIVGCGKNAKKFIIGERVVVDPNTYCGNCYHCANDNHHMCDNMIGVGTSVDGGFSENIIVNENLVFRLPKEVSFEVGALVEPLSCCVHGIELLNIQMGDHVMVVGAGNIGFMMIQLVKNIGASKIIAVEPNEYRRERAKQFGADIIIDPINDDTDKILLEHNIPNIEHVIDCAGLVSTAEYSVQYAGKKGKVMLFGLTNPDDTIKVKPFEIFQKELTITSSFVNPFSMQRAVALMKTKELHLDTIISDIIDLENINDVFEQKLYQNKGKILIKCSD